MKKLIFLSVLMSLILLIGGNSYAVFNSGSTGADGAFNPPSQVPPGTVVNGNNVTVPIPEPSLSVSDCGVYNFTTVNIPSGVTVTFTKNSKNTPVCILATGDVTISGTIDVSGQNASTSQPGSGGPGGYNGGYAGGRGLPAGNGLGPGGGGGGTSSCSYGAGGGFGTTGANYNNCALSGATYGNASLIPLIGGSGGGGQGYTGNNQHGAGGGGAILIASSGNINTNVTGYVAANGGGGFDSSGCGSGGGIKLMANAISGNGTIAAKGGAIGASPGGKGRIRLEAYTNSLVAGTDPPYSLNIYSATNPPGSVFLSHEPILRIDKIGGVTPATHTGSYAQPDIFLPSTTTNPVTVNLSAAYIPSGSTVTVSVIPQYGSTSSVDSTLTGVLEATTATASVTLSTTYSNVIMAQAKYTIQQAMYYENEKIDKVRVVATTGKESETIYITASGKEIPSKVLKLAGLVQ
jgi:hypothetical protein